MLEIQSQHLTVSTTTGDTVDDLKQTATLPITGQQPASTHVSLPINDILQHQQCNFKTPPDGGLLYETNQLYCDLCEYACELTNKSAIISHFLAKHPLDNIIYNYLWSQPENTDLPYNETTNRMKHYLVKAHLKIRYKDLNESLTNMPETDNVEENALNAELQDVLNQIIKTIEQQQADYIQEIVEEQQEVHEVNIQTIDQDEHLRKTAVQEPQDQQQQEGGGGGENLFVFKCNLCDTHSTDDLTQLLDHYKLVHGIELSVSDSSILLTAAIAAFQTGHTIEMTGAILNTLSKMTNEQGMTIINGEEVPVHTTVQYKCTLCFEIFYEKVFIVQHLHDIHQFDVDIGYFEALEAQQQEQLQQKLFEQEQEQQLQLVASVSQQHVLQQQQEMAIQQQQMQLNQQQQNEAALVAHAEAQANMHLHHHLHHSHISGLSGHEQGMMQTGSSVAGMASDVNMYKCDLCDFRNVSFDIVRRHEKSHFQSSSSSSSQPSDTTVANAALSMSAASQPRYTCSYCMNKMDNLKRINEHMKKAHPHKDLICMDTYKNMIIKINDELLLTSPPPPPSQSQLHQSPQQQQQYHKQASSTALSVQQQQHQSTSLLADIVHNTTSSTPVTTGQTTATTTPTTTMTNKRRSHATHVNKNQEVQIQANEIVQLFLDANNQLFIDFNENDELQCVYCESVINGLNFMRAHIKYKHKDKKILFRNRKNMKLYSIVNDTLNQPSGSGGNNSDVNRVKKEPGESLTNGILTPQQNFVLNEDTIKYYSFLNITLNCHYCWAQFQLNASKNPKENGNNKFMQHLILHLNAPYLCGECSYPVRDYKTFVKHKEFYKHDETAMIAKVNKCDMVENRTYKYLLNEKNRNSLFNETLLKSGPPTSTQGNQLASTINDSPYKYKCSHCYKYSNEKEDLLKHILIMHLAFLAYKCDLCQFYAFDEMQIKQHGIKMHKINDCKSKLIKTEEEINLALNRANQLIITNENQQLVNCAKQSGGGGSGVDQALITNSLCDVKPKYKCSKCVQIATEQQNQQQQQQPNIVLYTYTEAIEHIIKQHLNSTNIQKQMQQTQLANKKICFELELLEENLENLKDKTVHMPQVVVDAETALHQENNTQDVATSNPVSNKRKHDQIDEDLEEDDRMDKSFVSDDEWNCTLYDELHKRTYHYRKSLVIKCKLCERKLNQYPLDHLLSCHQSVRLLQLNCTKCKPQVQFDSLYEFYFHIKNQHYLKVQQQSSGTTPTCGDTQQQQQPLCCFICAAELKTTNLNEHFQLDHSISLNDYDLNSELSLLVMTYLQSFNLIDVYEYVRPRNPLYNKGLLKNNLNCIQDELYRQQDLYKQHVTDKVILNWLNLDQFLIKNFSFSSYQCAICSLSRECIIKTLPNPTQLPQLQQNNVNMDCISLLSLEADDVILCIANHILQHFNEYCYRCIACKISWPDRTQLLKHSYECPNSQVVRTKTKYKLKAQSRQHLQFNLLTMKQFWFNEIDLCKSDFNVNSIINRLSQQHNSNSNAYINLKDCCMDVNRSYLLNESVNSNLSRINLADNRALLLENVQNDNELDDY